MHRAPSLKMLEERADYEGKEKEEAAGLRLGSNQALSEVVEGVPMRTPPQIAHIWIFPEEMAPKSYFWGAWITVEVEGGKWDFDSTASRVPEKPQSKTKQQAVPKVKAPGGKS
ncbi:MAG: hypothetical protein AB7T49_19895 [Oligoflexales bacterium]